MTSKNKIQKDLACATECICENTDGLVPAILSLKQTPVAITSPDQTINVQSTGENTFEIEVNPEETAEAICGNSIAQGILKNCIDDEYDVNDLGNGLFEFTKNNTQVETWQLTDSITKVATRTFEITHPDGSTELLISSVDTDNDNILGIFEDPIFYIRDGGVAQPPGITNQQGVITGDTGVANAFGSWSQMENFVEQALLFGSITIDIRGVQQKSSGDFIVNTTTFQNADPITIKGDPNDVEAATFNLYNYSTSQESRFFVSNIQNFNIQDVTFNILESLTSSTTTEAFVSSGSNSVMRGNIKIKGYHNNDDPNAGNMRMLAAYTGSQLAFNDGCILTVEMSAGTKVQDIFHSEQNSVVRFNGSFHFEVTDGFPFEATEAVVRVLRTSEYSSAGTPVGGDLNNISNPTSSGTEQILSPASWKVERLSQSISSLLDTSQYSGFDDWHRAFLPKTNRTINLMYTDKVSFLNAFDGYGLDNTDPDVTVF